ncbi:MAG: 2-amino-4-hydroxy-6-hydroxymethyldihydropteridine diphosphokinase [Magnetococcales bacterium]|nr:2-amino-4-hydroxy-6-hydroxymethyldihydropteridine diphosphokinase [Magnetococcales bacterium]
MIPCSRHARPRIAPASSHDKTPLPPSGNGVFPAWIGIGSNQGNPLRQCHRVLTALSRHRRLRLLAVSSFYRTEPVGFLHQPWFVNAVALFSTTLHPLTLLNLLQCLERRFGRTRRNEPKNGPRAMDLDLLFHGRRIQRHPRLILPHPGIPHRRFVLVPLAEISPWLKHPLSDKIIDLLLEETDDVSQVMDFSHCRKTQAFPVTPTPGYRSGAVIQNRKSRTLKVGQASRIPRIHG